MKINNVVIPALHPPNIEVKHAVMIPTIPDIISMFFTFLTPFSTKKRTAICCPLLIVTICFFSSHNVTFYELTYIYTILIDTIPSNVDAFGNIKLIELSGLINKAIGA